MILDRYIQTRLAARPVRDNGKLRAFLKTLSWRVVGTVDTICISYFLTGTLDVAIQIGSVEVVSKMILYYFHERLWDRNSR